MPYLSLAILRRLVLLIALVIAAAAITAADDASAADWQAKWKNVIAAAEKEGVLSLGGPRSAASRRVIEKFQKAYPKIKLKYTAIHGAFWQRLASERAAGVNAWDVFVGGAAVPTYEAAKKGRLLPIRSAAILPDVLDDTKWINGFSGAFGDNAREHVFSFTADRLDLISVNRSKVPESALNSTKQLLDPKWKGKIVMMDPRQQGVGALVLGSLQKDLGDEGARKFLMEQLPVFTKDRRQAPEWVIRGRYPVGIGVVIFYYKPFLKKGLAKDIGYLKSINPVVTSSQAVVTLISKPPHPNAAKVFLNWLLSRKTQADWAKSTGTNSLRTDVPSGNPKAAVSRDQFAKLPHANTEEGVDFFFRKSSAFARSILK